MTKKYFYYTEDGATFRQPEGMAGVSDVATANGWKPYKGDPIAPIHFGNRITADQAGEPAETEASGEPWPAGTTETAEAA